MSETKAAIVSQCAEAILFTPDVGKFEQEEESISAWFLDEDMLNIERYELHLADGNVSFWDAARSEVSLTEK